MSHRRAKSFRRMPFPNEIKELATRGIVRCGNVDLYWSRASHYSYAGGVEAMKVTSLALLAGVVFLFALSAFAGPTTAPPPPPTRAPEFDASTAALGLALAGSAIAAIKGRFSRRRG